MSANRQYRFLTVLFLGILALLIPQVRVSAQEINPQLVMPGSIQPGNWYEQWNQTGTLYCPNNPQRFITTTSEPFTLSATAAEQVLSVSYGTSRVQIYLTRASNGSFVYTNATNGWVHLLEVTPISPSQMSVQSTFRAIDGSCTLTNQATWSFTGTTPPAQTCTVYPAGVAVNKRSGPGLNYRILGQLLPNTTAGVINVAYDAQGRRWWQLTDYTWVSSVVTVAQGNCPA